MANSSDVVQVWPEGGIQELSPDANRLSVKSVREIAIGWKTRRESADQEALRSFTEQLDREWALETGAIENLYEVERGVTETLIEQGFNAALITPGSTDISREELLALLNDQKAALEGLFAFVKQERPLTTGYIRELHAAMTRSQLSVRAIDLAGNMVEVPMQHGQWKTQPNYPRRGGHEFRYCPPEQTSSEMDRLIGLHETLMAQGLLPEVGAAWLHHRFTQIHPFQDGNGRVARALASLVLIQAGLFPLVVPASQKSGYIDALETADSGNLAPLVMLIARRQQSAYMKAISMLDKFAPASNNMQEAAEALAKALSHRDESRQSLLVRRQAYVANEVITSAKTLLTQAVQIVKAAYPGIKLNFEESVPNTSGRYFDIVSQALAQQGGHAPAPPYSWIKASITAIGQQFTVTCHTHSLNPEWDQSLEIVSLFQVGDEIVVLNNERLQIDDTTALNAVGKLVSTWLSSFVAQVLNAIRSRI